jgi:hypothetical protein
LVLLKSLNFVFQLKHLLTQLLIQISKSLHLSVHITLFLFYALLCCILVLQCL